jgi:hypothetical protein
VQGNSVEPVTTEKYFFQFEIQFAHYAQGALVGLLKAT